MNRSLNLIDVTNMMLQSNFKNAYFEDDYLIINNEIVGKIYKMSNPIRIYFEDASNLLFDYFIFFRNSGCRVVNNF